MDLRLFENVMHSFQTLKRREDEIGMKVRGLCCIRLKPFSKGTLRPIFKRICSFPIDEDVVVDDRKLNELERPMVYTELDGRLYLDWKKRHKIKRKANSGRRFDEKRWWERWRDERDLSENDGTVKEEEDEYECDFTMDFFFN